MDDILAYFNGDNWTGYTGSQDMAGQVSKSMFTQDPDTVKSVYAFKSMALISAIGVFALWVVFGVWIVWRLGPAGYSLTDAQLDRSRMCAAILEALPENVKWNCPGVRGRLPE